MKKEVEVENWKEHTLVAQRSVCGKSIEGGIEQALAAVSQDVKTMVREIP